MPELAPTLPVPEEPLLLDELNHRIINDFASLIAIGADVAELARPRGCRRPRLFRNAPRRARVNRSISALRRCAPNVRVAPDSGRGAGILAGLGCANMYGPAVRCKTDFQDQRT